MRDFKDLTIWQRGMDVVETTYDLIALLPDSERFGLRTQMARCSVSIPSNIAEGCSRKSDKHFIQYLETALGSTFELQTQALIVQRRFSVPTELIEKLNSQLEEERKMLARFIANLSKSLPS
jgi:four helix bundle protein